MNYLITGAGSGIGKAIAVALSKQGHTCYLPGRNEAELNSTLSFFNKGNQCILLADIDIVKQVKSNTSDKT